MSVTITSSSYAGEEAGKYISAALLTANTLEGGLIEIHDNVKYREVIQKLSSTSLVQAADCDFNDSGDVQLDEIVLEPKELMVNVKMCTKPFVQSWESAQLGMSAHDDELPAKFEDYVIAHFAEKVAANIERQIWQGDDSNGAEFDGIIKLLEADANVIDVAASANTLDATEVLSELGAIVDAIPQTVYSQMDKLCIAVSSDIFRAYKRALGGFQSQGTGGAGFESKGFNQDIDVQYFDGVPVVLAQGLPTRSAVAYLKDNIYFGTGLLSDHNEVRVLNMADLDGSQNVKFIMRFTGGVQIGIGSEIVLYK